MARAKALTAEELKAYGVSEAKIKALDKAGLLKKSGSTSGITYKIVEPLSAEQATEVTLALKPLGLTIARARKARV